MGSWTLLTGGDFRNIGFRYTWFHTRLWQGAIGIVVFAQGDETFVTPLMFSMFNDETYVDLLSFSLC
jgi:hypothetical protein